MMLLDFAELKVRMLKEEQKIKATRVRKGEKTAGDEQGIAKRA